MRLRWKYRYDRRFRGLCRDCPSPKLPDSTYCLTCREKERKRTLAKSHKYRDEGKCPKCSQPLHEEMDEDRKTCLSCREVSTTPKIRRSIGDIHRIGFTEST